MGPAWVDEDLSVSYVRDDGERRLEFGRQLAGYVRRHRERWDINAVLEPVQLLGGEGPGDPIRPAPPRLKPGPPGPAEPPVPHPQPPRRPRPPHPEPPPWPPPWPHPEPPAPPPGPRPRRPLPPPEPEPEPEPIPPPEPPPEPLAAEAPQQTSRPAA